MKNQTSFKKGHKGYWLGKKNQYITGERNHWWKGYNVGYWALHKWINKEMGKAIKCVNGHNAEQYVWANISGEYKRELSDWHQLCKSCNKLDGIKKHERFINNGY